MSRKISSHSTGLPGPAGCLVSFAFPWRCAFDVGVPGELAEIQLGSISHLFTRSFSSSCREGRPQVEVCCLIELGLAKCLSLFAALLLTSASPWYLTSFRGLPSVDT